MTRILTVRSTDYWRTEYVEPENVRIEGDELIFERETEPLGRHEIRLDLDEVRDWRLVEHHSGLEREGR